MFLTLLKTILLGIVEGVTEWLPVSSTGHLILVNSFLNMQMSEEFMEMFDVVIQLGAILAVVVPWFGELWPFHTAAKAPLRSQFAHVETEGFAGRFQSFADKYLYMDKVMLWLKIFVAVLPAVVIGLPLDDWLDAHLYRPSVIALMLILYGVLFIVVENRNAGRQPVTNSLRRITFRQALLIGLFQCLALIPGTSRSGATIIGGILIGLNRTTAAKFTFYLAIPTMLGASLLKLVKYGLAFTPFQLIVLLVGMAVAFAVSMAAIRFLMNYIRNHDFKIFGWYRIALGVLVLVLGFAGVLKV